MPLSLLERFDRYRHEYETSKRLKDALKQQVHRLSYHTTNMDVQDLAALREIRQQALSIEVFAATASSLCLVSLTLLRWRRWPHLGLHELWTGQPFVPGLWWKTKSRGPIPKKLVQDVKSHPRATNSPFASTATTKGPSTSSWAFYRGWALDIVISISISLGLVGIWAYHHHIGYMSQLAELPLRHCNTKTTSSQSLTSYPLLVCPALIHEYQQLLHPNQQVWKKRTPPQTRNLQVMLEFVHNCQQWQNKDKQQSQSSIYDDDHEYS